MRAQELILEITLYIMPSFEKLVSSEHYIDIIKIGLGPLYFV